MEEQTIEKRFAIGINLLTAVYQQLGERPAKDVEDIRMALKTLPEFIEAHKLNPVEIQGEQNG